VPWPSGAAFAFATWMSQIRRSFHHSLQMGSERTLHEGGDPAAAARVQGDLRRIAVDGGEPSPRPVREIASLESLYAVLTCREP
jgi:hypothetical protein